MSHAATNWAIQQRGLKPATKIVLWNLADRHNRDTRRCDPNQDRLAYDCEMARSTLNVHLSKLEAAGLIRRVQRVDPRTRRQMSTFYELAFDTDLSTPENTAKPGPKTGHGLRPETGHGAVSGKSSIPCPENSDSRVRNPDTNPVREPGREPDAGEPAAGNVDFFGKFFQVYPNPVEKRLAEKAWKRAIARGAEPDALVAAAIRYASSKEVKRGFAKKPANWLDADAWLDFAAIKTKTVSPEDIAARRAAAIREGKDYMVRNLSASDARDLVAAGLVTQTQCRAVGVYL